MTSRAVLGGALAATVASMVVAAPSFASTPKSGGVFIPAKAGETIPARGGTATSLNWSGYAVTPATADITAVNSTFTVPTAGPLIPGFAATWAGIGGYSSSDLIQAGVTENSAVGSIIGGGQYYAWYEILPASETEITSGCVGDTSCTVTPGDTVSVSISNVSGDTWSVSISDAGKWTWQKDITYASSESSAEWILEAPTVAVQSAFISNVGTTYFGPTNTYTAGGQTYTIAQGDPTTLDLSPSPVPLPDGLGDEATPSPLAANGESFNDCTYALSCATPAS